MQIPDGTRQINLNGTRLSLQTLVIIADELERTGSVYVTNGAVMGEPEIPRRLGLRVMRDSTNGYECVSVEPLEGPNDHEGQSEAAEDPEAHDRASGISA